MHDGTSVFLVLITFDDLNEHSIMIIATSNSDVLDLLPIHGNERRLYFNHIHFHRNHQHIIFTELTIQAPNKTACGTSWTVHPPSCTAPVGVTGPRRNGTIQRTSFEKETTTTVVGVIAVMDKQIATSNKYIAPLTITEGPNTYHLASTEAPKYATNVD